MRVNNRKYPILDILTLSKEEFIRKQPLGYGLPNHQVVSEGNWPWVRRVFEHTFDDITKILKEGAIDLITHPFLHTVHNNLDMLDKIDFNDFIKENKNLYGILLTEGGATIYDFRELEKWWAAFITFDIYIIAYACAGNEEGYMGVADTLPTVSPELQIRSIVEHVKSILLFKKYAKTETIHIKPKEKIKDPRTKEKHLNESNIPINILDCTWFTNIVRNEPFGVRGHFRLQPKKDTEGKWIKEMIYIKPFIKTGYNIKAKKPDNK